MQPRPTSDPQRDSRETSRTAVTALERRIAELEQLTDSQSRELRIQFERIAQMQGEWDILRIRFIKSQAHHRGQSYPSQLATPRSLRDSCQRDASVAGQSTDRNERSGG